MSTEDGTKQRLAIISSAAESNKPADESSAWTPAPAQYETWNNYAWRSEPALPPGAESDTCRPQPHQTELTISIVGEPGSHPRLGYYPSQHLQHAHQSQQQGGQVPYNQELPPLPLGPPPQPPPPPPPPEASISSHQSQQQGGQVPYNQGLPPLPSGPPPQPPPPPEASISLPSCGAVTGSGMESRGVTEGPGFSYSSFYNHQQQTVQESNSSGQDGPANSNSAATASATPSNAPANGEHYYGQSYLSYSAATSGDQYAYGSGNYSGYNYGYAQQQGNDSYSRNMGPTYQDIGAVPYPPVNSFPSTSSYTDSTFYQTIGTYYNAGVYQNTGGYPSSGYSGHPNSWSENNYASYGGYPGYTGYATPDQNSALGSGVVSNENQYQQQDYRSQWADYYANSESNPPGTLENAPGTAPSSTLPPTCASVVAQGPGGLPHAAASNEPPPPGTQPSWQLPAPSYGSSTQANPATTKISNYWDGSSIQSSQPDPHHHQVLQNDFQAGPPQQASLGNTQLPTLHIQQVKQSQPLKLQHPQTQQAQVETASANAFQPQDPQMMKSGPQWRQGTMQIPTSARIVSNYMGKGSSGNDSTQKPGYISVGAKAGKLSSDDIADATLQPGMFPSSLRAYVERALSRCKDEAKKSACQDVMKEMITAASRDGSLFTKDWDTEPPVPLPSVPSTSSREEVLPGTSAGMSEMKTESSPSKRMRSRWEPISEDELEDRHGQLSQDIKKDNVRDRLEERNSVSPPKREEREGSWRAKSVQQQNAHHLSLAKSARRGPKKGRRLSGPGVNGIASTSESKKGTKAGGLGVSGVILGSLVSVETPEEKKKRQSRTERFDHGKEKNVGLKGGLGKVKAGFVGTASTRRATVLQLAMSYGDGNGHAVEDIDWDSLTVRGTSQETEKRYLRLTSAPDPSTVRPEEVLKKSLAMVQSTPKSYLFRCEQLKSIRQDLTVQRIRHEFTVQVYETHARMALESGDFPEYNQCQTQLKGLYGEGIRGCSSEFTGYSLLYIIFNHGNSRDLLSTMARLSKKDRNDETVKHALAVRAAVSLGNYTAIFKLYRTAPNLSRYLMDKHVEKMRFEAVKCMTRSYRPSLPVTFVARTLGFSGILTFEGGEEKEVDGLDECQEWLRSHGTHIIFDSTVNELVLDTKTSATSLYMPEPEYVVPHGDANLALNDFFSVRS